ncbi:MAG: aminotransferase [Rhizobiales bacterium]|nr:aminotransferase [Hyphomicrobiales bacterium]OJY43291.1 MAG: aminotransferase [Rhizobiales bacterium 64-17]
MNPIFAGLPVSVFEVMSGLARDHAAVNLGQGFPDDPGPEDVRRKAAEAVVSGWNQYPPMLGLPELRQAVAAHYQHWQNLTLDPDREIMITSGATEALAGALMALIEPGDEVVLFQPLYDAYLPLVQRAGGVPKFVRLEPPHWRFTDEMLERAFSPKTKVVLFNNPLNPTGTVYAREDLERLAAFCQRYDAIAVCDEVWEHVIFDGRAHLPLIAIDGMRERCVKVGSAGKIFSLTGWKVGFVCAAPQVLRVLAKAHQYITFTTPPNLQVAVAYGLAKADDYFTTMRADFQRSRDRFADGLRTLGFPTLDAQGTYFLNVDLAPLGLNQDDETFCKRLVTEHKVAAIPVSAFYADDPIRSVVRFCFAKRDATLDAALEKLAGVLPRAG